MSALWQIERFLAATGMPPTRFGRDVANDPRLVLDMRNGREPKPQMAARIDAYIAGAGK